MTQVDAYITAPYQGVSQAPPQVRLPEQAEILEDVGLNLAEGATKRPPITYLGALESHPGSTNGVFAMVERPDGNRILTATLESGHVVPRVYGIDSLTLEPVTVSADAQVYLDAGAVSPVDDLRTLTVQDFTFFTNRQKLVANGTATSPTRPFECLLWLRAAAYGKTYNITVTPVGGSPTQAYIVMPNGTNHDINDSPFVDTSVIMDILYHGGSSNPSLESVLTTPTGGYDRDGLRAGGSLNSIAGFTTQLVGPVIYLSCATDFSVAAVDGEDGQSLVAVKEQVQAFSDLPKAAVDGFTVRVIGTDGPGNDDFFVKYDVTAGGSTGIWAECPGPDVNLGVDPKTMPVGLVDDSGWQVNVLAWTGRTVGDEALNPDPDFVGASIQDMTFWRGRLAVLSNEGVTLSAATNPFQLYPSSLSTVLDGDPVGLLSPYPGISILRYAVPFGKRLIAFGDRSQVQVHSNEQVFTPTTAQIDLLASYEFEELMRPINSNGKLYFAAPKGETSSAIYELGVTSDAEITNLTEAEEMTAPLPTYIPSGLNLAAYCPVNYLNVYGIAGATSFIVHNYRSAQGERVQNAFDRWNIPAGFTLGGFFFENTKLYLLLVDAENGAHVGVLDTAPGILDEDSDVMTTHLDMRLREDQVTLTYVSLYDQTLVTLPYPATGPLRVAARAPGGVGGPHITTSLLPAPEGFLAEILADPLGDTPGLDQFVLRGNWTACPLWIGLMYTMQIRLSRIYAMGPDKRPMRSGRLQLRRLRIDFATTGYFRVVVAAKGRTSRAYEMTGYRLDDPASIWNAPPNVTNVFSVPILSQNEQVEIDIINDSHFPCHLLGWEWVGEFNPRAQRI